MSDISYYFDKFWDPRQAEFVYRLVGKHKFLFANRIIYGAGNYDWARKNADHYNIPIPEEETIE